MQPTRDALAVHITDTGAACAADVHALGSALYDRLTRPLAPLQCDGGANAKRPERLANHLGCIAGVPVYFGAKPDALDFSLAYDNVVIIVRSDGASIADGVATKLEKTWDALPRPPHLCHVTFTSHELTEENVSQSLAAIVDALKVDGQMPALSLSFAKESAHALEIANALEAAVANSAPTLFRRTQRHLWRARERTGAGGAVLLIRDDEYSADQRCLRDLINAKTNGVPVLDLIALSRGEARGSSAQGNLRSLVWAKDAKQVIAQAACEWIRSRAFSLRARRILEVAKLPDCRVLTRRPELLDVCSSQTESAAAGLILHPDPELTVKERKLLTAANPRLQFITPTTAYRFLRRELNVVSDPNSLARSRRTPLDGIRVGLSLSQSGDDALSRGVTAHHYDDAVAYASRCVISAGGAIAYGGDVRATGYTKLLGEMVRAYGRRASTQPEMLHSYLDAHLQPGDDPAILFHSLRDNEVDRLDARLTADDAASAPIYAHSDTRRVMADSLDASILIGGKDAPLIAIENGYSGLFPGVLEEAWRMLALGKPVYVAGGFGGAASQVAALFYSGKVPPTLQQRHWGRDNGGPEYFADLHASPWRQALGLPDSMEDMAAAVQNLAATFLSSDEVALNWNGLTRAENKRLSVSADPVTISGLVLKGLTYLSTQKSKGKLDIELVHGDLIAAEPLHALSLPAVRGLPLTGAAHRVDQLIQGRLAQAVQKGQSLLGVQDSPLPTDWVHVAALKTNREATGPGLRVDSGVEDLVAQSRRAGFEKVGVVLYGGTLVDQVDPLIDAMVSGLGPLAGQATILWYEKDRDRFRAIEKRIASKWSESVRLATSAGEPLLTAASTTGTSILVDYDQEKSELHTFVMPPNGTAMASRWDCPVSEKELSALSLGVPLRYPKSGKIYDPDPRYYPVEEILARGARIAELMFGKKYAQQLCDRLLDQPVQIAHDRASSSIPFELLCSSAGQPLVTGGPWNRRLTVPHAAPETLFAPPLRKGELSSLLIIDPKGDLKGAAAEGEAVFKVLDSFSKVTVLREKQATRAAVLEHLERADLVHYCGHGFFLDETQMHCGLSLNDWDLRLEHLRDLKQVPRIAVMNACEVGRLVDHERKILEDSLESEPAAFAEFFLHAGTQVFVGAHWLLADRSGKSFSDAFYTSLFQGETVSSSMHLSRQALAKEEGLQWGNYVLYGQGDVRLCRPG